MGFLWNTSSTETHIWQMWQKKRDQLPEPHLLPIIANDFALTYTLNDIWCWVFWMPSVFRTMWRKQRCDRPPLWQDNGTAHSRLCSNKSLPFPSHQLPRLVFPCLRPCIVIRHDAVTISFNTMFAIGVKAWKLIRWYDGTGVRCKSLRHTVALVL